MKYLLLERHTIGEFPNEETVARAILFDEDPETGAKSVEDIREAPTAWQVIDNSIFDVAWLSAEGLRILDPGQDHKFIDLVPDLMFKTREVRVRRVLEKLEAALKTGLDISKPKDTFARDKGGRFASKETLP